MFKKEEVSSAQENAQAKHELKEGECGGCGTFENVTENSCVECTKGYSEADGVSPNAWLSEFYKDQIIK
jgi:hypothetical protein